MLWATMQSPVVPVFECFARSEPSNLVACLSKLTGPTTILHQGSNPATNPCTRKSSPFPYGVSQFTSLRSCCLHLGFLVPQLFAAWQRSKVVGVTTVGFLRFLEVSWFGSLCCRKLWSMEDDYSFECDFTGPGDFQIFVNWWWNVRAKWTSWHPDMFQLRATASHLWFIFNMRRQRIWMFDDSVADSDSQAVIHLGF